MNVRALDQQAYCLTGKSFLSANFLFNSMMSHTKSKFADPAVNFSQILPIRWFCEVFYQHNIDTKNDVVSKFSIAGKVEFHSQDLGILHVWKMPYPLQVKQYIYVW